MSYAHFTTILGPEAEDSRILQENSRNLLNRQDKQIKLYIFDISVKFRVDWCIIRLILKMFQKYILAVKQREGGGVNHQNSGLNF